MKLNQQTIEKLAEHLRRLGHTLGHLSLHQCRNLILQISIHRRDAVKAMNIAGIIAGMQ